MATGSKDDHAYERPMDEANMGNVSSRTGDDDMDDDADESMEPTMDEGSTGTRGGRTSTGGRSTRL